MLRKNIYRWHRILSLTIALPVVLWAASGFMHPVMTTIRPRVATQFLPAAPLDTNRIKLPLRDVLQKNSISNFHNFRLVHIDTNWFYQVQKTANETPLYLSVINGKKLANGDALYAQYLAKLFLEGPPVPIANATQYASISHEDMMTDKAVTAAAEHDCCDAATACILGNETGSPVAGIALLRSFDAEYKFINRLLPVYKVKFDRPDGIRLYVETTQDRFAFAMDNKRAVFDKIFGLFHTWEWMNFLGNSKYYVMALLNILALLTTLMGLYIFFVSKTKKANGKEVVKARNRHRWTSFAISLFTLMFTFSGAYHSLSKLKTATRADFFTSNQFTTGAANPHLSKLQALAGDKPISNISLVKINGEIFWQVFTINKQLRNKMPATAKDLMKNMSAPPPSTFYVNTHTYAVLSNGEELYARSLAGLFTQQPDVAIVQTKLITKFAGEYGFVNKRLPVWKIGYASNSRERLYVETSTGKLAAQVNDKDLVEGYSFSLLHKHEFMAWAGKPVKDFSTMFWATAQIAMVLLGFILYFKMKARKSGRIQLEKDAGV